MISKNKQGHSNDININNNNNNNNKSTLFLFYKNKVYKYVSTLIVNKS